MIYGLIQVRTEAEYRLGGTLMNIPTVTSSWCVIAPIQTDMLVHSHGKCHLFHGAWVTIAIESLRSELCISSIKGPRICHFCNGNDSMNYRKLFALSSRATKSGWFNISQGTRTRIIEPIRYFLDNGIALNRIKKHQVCFILTKILTNVPFVHWNLVVRGLARISRRGMFSGCLFWKIKTQH